MKAQITRSLMAVAFLLLGLSTAAKAQFNPSPKDGPRFTLTTTQEMGTSLRFFFDASDDNAWVDLNGDGVYQNGEELKKNKVQFVKITRQTLTFYGDYTRINGRNNQMSSLELTLMPNLLWVQIPDNKLTALDLSNTPKLQELYCQGNKIKGLNLSKTPDLNRLACYENEINEAKMTELVESLPTPTAGGLLFPLEPIPSVGDKNVCTKEHAEIAKKKNWSLKNPMGEDLFGPGAGFTPAPVDGGHIALVTNKAAGKTIRLKVSSLKNHAWIDLNGNKTCEKDEEISPDLENEFVLSKQDVVVYGDFTKFDCERNELTSIKLTSVPGLVRLLCGENALSDLDLSAGYAKLTYLACYANKIENLDLSKLPELEWLYCYENKLKNLDLSSLLKLYCVHLGSNQISTLDVRKKPSLTQVYLYGNQINEEAMQKIVDALPTVKDTDTGYFVPFDTKMENPSDANICTKKQVAIAKKKNWKVNARNGESFPGTDGLEDITAARLPIKLHAKEGILRITGLEIGMPIIVYTLDGTMVYQREAQGEDASIALPSGSYVLRIGNYSAKTSMR